MKNICFFFEPINTSKITQNTYWIMLFSVIILGLCALIGDNVGFTFYKLFFVSLYIIGGSIGAGFWFEVLMVTFKLNENIRIQRICKVFILFSILLTSCHPIHESTLVQKKELTLIEEFLNYKSSKLPFTFQYPVRWKTQFPEIEVINLEGDVVSTEVTFNDSTSNIFCNISYRTGDNIISLYQDAVSKKENQNTKVETYNGNGFEAIIQKIIIERDGKGHKLNPPDSLYIIDFLNINKKGEVQILYRQSSTGSYSVNKNVIKLLSSFYFIK
jgi:hypothetical protein